jgi:hypothetical protein
MVAADLLERMVIAVYLQSVKANIQIIAYFEHRMRKGLSVAGIIICLVLAGIYLWIPSKLNVVVVLPLKCNVDAADRSLRDTGNRAGWWDFGVGGEIGCQVTGVFRRMLDVSIVDGGMVLASRVTIVPNVQIDSCALQWETELSSGLNPIRRIGRYRQAKRLAADMEKMLSRLGSRLEDQRRVYGMVIKESKGNSTDSMLVSIQRVFGRYPSDSAVYALVGILRQFVLRNGGQEAGPPMLNVTTEVRGGFKAEVGLPTDKIIADKGDIRWRELIRVQFLEAEVRGGDYTIRDAVRQMGNYISDYQRTVMGLPYQSLMTDRIKETDTTKWVTRLFVPVFPHLKGS